MTDGTDWLLGGEASLGLNYRVASRTHLHLGLQYQHLGATSQSVSGKNARVDLSNSISLSVGLRWRF